MRALVNTPMRLECYEGGDHTGLLEGPWISGFTPYFSRQLENRRHLAFDVRNMEQSIMTGVPPGVLEVVRGRFNPDATEQALNLCSECTPTELEEYLGVEFYSWGGDLEVNIQKALNPPAFDNLGRGGRIAVLDSFVFRTVETPGMRSLIGAYAGRDDSLADIPELALSAREMDELGLYSGLIMGNVETLSFEGVLGNICAEAGATESDCDQLKARVEETGVLDAYDVLGAGAGMDEGGPFVAFIFIYGDESDAKRNIPVFEQMVSNGASLRFHGAWSEHFSDAEVWSEGKKLIAKLRARNLLIWALIVQNRDSLLLHR